MSGGEISDDELRDMEEHASAAEEKKRVVSMKRRDLDRHLGKSAKQEKKLVRSIKNERSKYSSSKAVEKPTKLVELLGTERELFDVYALNYMICKASADKRDMRYFEKQIKKLLKDYDRDLEAYGKLSAQKQSPVSAEVLSYIKEHDTPPTLPIPTVPKSDESGNDKGGRRAMQREQLALARSDKKERRKEKKRGRSDDAALARRQIANDEQTVAARIEYRINRYDYAVTKTKFSFGDETGKEKRERKTVLAKLKAMRSAKGAAMKAAGEDNKRYFEVATASADNAKAKRGADRERLAEIIERVGLLLTERDGVNRRLDSLYRENEAVFSTAKNTRKRITELKLAEAKRVFRGKLKDYKRISKYKIPEKEKQPLYDAMNKQIELSAYAAELKFRLKTEHPHGDARHALRDELRATAKKLRYAERDFSRLKKRLGSKAKREGGSKSNLTWIIVLILLIALGAAAYIFFKEEMTAFFSTAWSFITGLFSKNA